MLPIKCNHLRTIVKQPQVLLEEGFADCLSPSSESILTHVAKRNKLEVVQLLLKHKIDNIRDPTISTCDIKVKDGKSFLDAYFGADQGRDSITRN